MGNTRIGPSSFINHDCSGTATRQGRGKPGYTTHGGSSGPGFSAVGLPAGACPADGFDLLYQPSTAERLQLEFISINRIMEHRVPDHLAAVPLRSKHESKRVGPNTLSFTFEVQHEVAGAHGLGAAGASRVPLRRASAPRDHRPPLQRVWGKVRGSSSLAGLCHFKRKDARVTRKPAAAAAPNTNSDS